MSISSSSPHSPARDDKAGPSRMLREAVVPEYKSSEGGDGREAEARNYSQKNTGEKALLSDKTRLLAHKSIQIIQQRLACLLL